jgi:hypothetical protein
LRRVKIVDAFYESLSKLDRSEETTRAGAALLLRATNHPERGKPVPDYVIRKMETRRNGPLPPLLLYYAYDDETLFLLWIEVIDELA